MSVTVCWSVKGGSGTTVVAATLALARATNSLLIDLDGELPAVLGLPDPAGQGIGDWLASDAPVGAIADLAVEVDRTTQLVPRGAVPVDRHSPRWAELGPWLLERPYTTVVDAGTGDPPNPLGDVGRTLLVTRGCYLALRRASAMAWRPDGVVLVAEPGRALRGPDVERAVGAPVVAAVSFDPAVARAVDAGLLASPLARRLEREGVDLRFFSLLAGGSTPVAFATFDHHGDPSFRIYGGLAAAVESVDERLEDAIAAASALVFTSTTLAGRGEARVTRRARELALAHGVRVCFDPNIRPHRWGGERGPAVAASRELVAGSFMVRANRDEAVAITGVDDPRRAAAEIAAMGVELAVVTLGAEGAVTSGATEVELPAVDVEVVSTLGAGDAFMGTLVAGLSARDWDPGRAAEALGPALSAAADACGRWSALA